MAERGAFFARYGKTIASAIAKMADVFLVGDLTRWLLSLARFLPDRVLRWRWPPKRILDAIEAFHFSQAPRFYISSQRDMPELHYVGFNVFNLTPFKLAIVGVDIRVSLDSRDFITQQQAFLPETPMLPFARSGFQLRLELNERQVARVRAYQYDSVRIRVDGAMILRTPHGQLRKDVSAEVVTVIDRGDVRSGTF